MSWFIFKKRIKTNDLRKENFARKKKSILYLQSIGAFADLVEVTSDEESEDMDSSSDSDMSLDDWQFLNTYW